MTPVTQPRPLPQISSPAIFPEYCQLSYQTSIFTNQIEPDMQLACDKQLEYSTAGLSTN
jgi:hypothetical protein